jgi:hypothetical protein
MAPQGTPSSITLASPDFASIEIQMTNVKNQCNLIKKIGRFSYFIHICSVAFCLAFYSLYLLYIPGGWMPPVDTDGGGGRQLFAHKH